MAKGEGGLGNKSFQITADKWAQEIISHIPFSRLWVWKDFLVYPSETIAREKERASIVRGALDILTVQAAFYLLFAIVFIFAYLGLMLIGTVFLGSNISLVFYSLLGSAFTILAILAAAILCGLLLTLLLWVFNTVIDFGMAKILGGKGTFEQQAYMNALSLAAINTVSYPLLALTLVPCLGTFISFLSTAVSIYGLYPRFRVFSIVHGLDDVKALICTLMPVVIYTALIIIIAVLVMMYFIGYRA